MLDTKGTQQLVNLIRKIAQQEDKKLNYTSTHSATVVSVASDNKKADVTLATDSNTILTGLYNKTSETLSIGDQVIIHALNNSLTNSYIGLRKGDSTAPSSVSTPTQQAWQTPSLLNSWVNYGGTYNSVGYWKDSFGVVHLRGLVKDGIISQNIFILPTGYRPQNREIFTVNSNNAFGRVDIESDGRCFASLGVNNWVSLDGITFRAV